MLWLWRRYLKRYTGLMVIALIFMAIEGSMFGLLSYMMKPMFDEVFVGGNADALVWVGLAVMGIFFTRALSSIIQKVLLTRVSQMSMGDIRQDMLEHLMSLDPAFHNDHGPGYLIQRIEGDVNAISKVWSTLITGAGRDVIALISLFGVKLGWLPFSGWTASEVGPDFDFHGQSSFGRVFPNARRPHSACTRECKSSRPAALKAPKTL